MVSVSDFDRFVFVVGAPRCGTTTLAHFLKQHPRIGSPAVKEPHFFAQHDLRGLSDWELRRRVEDEYLRRYFFCDPRRRVGLDASVTYLYAPEQLEPILRLWPNSRFVVSVRDPLAMLPSLHQRLIYNGDETIPKFEDAWRAIANRTAGRNIPRRCADPRWLRYDQAARFGTYLDRLIAVVGEERCSIVVFDDLASDALGEYGKLMQFSGLETVPITDLHPRRGSKAVRSRWLQRLLKRPPKAVSSYFAGEQFHKRVRRLDSKEKILPTSVVSIRKKLLSWNRVSVSPASLPAALESRLCQELRGEVDQLGSILSRDLSHWLIPRR